MKAVLLFIAALLTLLGLTGVLWPEGLSDLAKYTFTVSGVYVAAAVRIITGLLLWSCARAARTPRTVRVIGAIILIGGIGTLFMTGARGEALRDWWLGRGPDAIRIVACLPLMIGLLIGGATLFNDRRR